MSRILKADKRVQEYISGRRDPDITQFMIGITSLGSTPVIGALLLFVYQLGSFTQFKYLTVSIILTAVTVNTIKHFSSRERPENQVINASFASSFPSGHSASAFTVATILSFFYPAFIPLSFVTASVVALSRVYLGEHFLSDITIGSALGTLMALLVISVL